MTCRNSRRRSNIQWKTERNSRRQRERTEEEFHVTRKESSPPASVSRVARTTMTTAREPLCARPEVNIIPPVEVHRGAHPGTDNATIVRGLASIHSARSAGVARKYSPGDRLEPAAWRGDRDIAGIIFQIFRRSPRHPLCRGIRVHSPRRDSPLENQSLLARLVISRIFSLVLARWVAQRCSRCTGPFTNSFTFKCLNRLSPFGE